MLWYILKRAVQGVFVVWGVVTVVFLLRVVTPGSPVDYIVPPEASEATRVQIAARLGLDQPLYVQYFDYVVGLLHGDMGHSYIARTEVAPRVLARLPATIELAIAATLLAICISIPLGVVSATRRGQSEDYVANVLSLVGISTPNFWLGIMLVLVFSVQLDLFPTSAREIGAVPAMAALLFRGDPSGLLTWLRHITLPAITLGTFFTALLMRLTRSGMIEELGKQYVTACRAKGLPETLVTFKHALRNTLIPIITVLGLQLGGLVGGAVVTEAVFAWPGLGSLVIDSVNRRDWPLIQGTLIVIGTGFVVVNMAVDILYTYFDPRIRYE